MSGLTNNPQRIATIERARYRGSRLSKPPTDTYTVRFKTELERLTALRLEAQTFEELPRGGPIMDIE